ncbi:MULTISPECIES: relaxase/mobilization nuclease domain-containing protein [Pseudomonas]|uniref:Relaxase/mobilization nuclease domain-containing protein n=1 Tax=Pseudomonas capeferrum TaxID=1495066 RepID=A0ABY7R8K2_9PSED|nr:MULTISPECIES: relaxase/mobilization nuclease domain-containing protein [Pseudomonas]MUT49200.1 relaxase/mobilization nuclease domain-containing protein [Pseudomonas sp. TDA1]WCI00095.1 relaxase/mobilization nuclease domain-containing protein [Pseudomonas capeferrum]
MIRKKLSTFKSAGSIGNGCNYISKKAALVGGSEAKFENTSMEEYSALAVKKFEQVNNKFENKSGRKQESKAIHEMISFHKDDDLTPEKAAELALSVWNKALDLENRKHRWAVHTDTDEMHVHLVWNKRNNQGEIYNQKDDYALFEKLLYETEIENDLTIVKNRKFLNPLTPTNPQPSNEYRHEQKGLKSEKSKFKDEVKSAIDNAMSSSDFLEIMDARGFSIIHNGNNAYTLEKDGIGFKASDVGASYKSLKQRFGEDLDFPDTLARIGKKTAPKRDFGGLSGPQFASADDEVTKEEKVKKSKKTLYTRFDSDDGKFFFFKDSPREAFRYERGSVTFNCMSPTAIKAGLQKMVEECEKKNDKEIFVTSDIRSFKRETWIQFQMMGLDKKGYKLNGFEPNQLDHIELRKRKSEFESKFSTGNSSITNVSTVKNPFDKLNESAQKMKEIEEMKKENEEKRKHVSNTRRNVMKPRL